MEQTNGDKSRTQETNHARPQDSLAFMLETIAHLTSDPALMPYRRYLLITASVVRLSTDAQLLEAVKGVDRG